MTHNRLIATVCALLGLVALGCHWPDAGRNGYDAGHAGVPSMEELERSYEKYGKTP